MDHVSMLSSRSYCQEKQLHKDCTCSYAAAICVPGHGNLIMSSCLECCKHMRVHFASTPLHVLWSGTAFAAGLSVQQLQTNIQDQVSRISHIGNTLARLCVHCLLNPLS